jgi:hypothetical protein
MTKDKDRETLHIDNKKVHPCSQCGLACIEEYFVLSPTIDFPERELRQYLCLFCMRDLVSKGVQVKKVNRIGKFH